MKTNKLTPAPEFKSGQIWRLGEDRLQIELVGKWLIHYRQYTGMDKKLPTRFTSRGDLEKLFATNKAVLVEEKTPKACPAPRVRKVRPATKSRTHSRHRSRR
jgi:hypothetical protein